nr:tyrosine-protein kinase STYK1-like [Pelodiscus sinensis]|eukprot:XP_025036503.1 tyrosine-protein kinase STYK1-like [Pelodiscus sinensis]
MDIAPGATHKNHVTDPCTLGMDASTRPGLPAKGKLPEDWQVLEEQFLCMGRYGPISRATLVRRGSLGPSLPVILKKLPVASSPQEMKHFIELMKFHIQICTHDSLVKALWCQSQTLPLCLVLEAMSLGNFLGFLWQTRQGSVPRKGHIHVLTEKKVFAMAIQIARGLDYLTASQRLIHGDVAARNVLIHQDLTRSPAARPSKEAAEVPIKWLPPERILKHPVTARSDVWAFGILLYEAVTLGAPPYPALQPSEVLPWLQRQHRMEKPDQCGDDLYRIMRSCWQWKASKRPTFSQLIDQLDSHVPRANEAETLAATERLDLSDYQRTAGVSPREVQLCLSEPCVMHKADSL